MTQQQLEIKAYLKNATHKTSITRIESEMGYCRNGLQSILKRGSLRYEMAKRIANMAGYELKWVKKGETV